MGKQLRKRTERLKRRIKHYDLELANPAATSKTKNTLNKPGSMKK